MLINNDLTHQNVKLLYKYIIICSFYLWLDKYICHLTRAYKVMQDLQCNNGLSLIQNFKKFKDAYSHLIDCY